MQIIQGAISIAIAFVAVFTLPDSPLKTRWLTPEERELAHRRIFEDVTNRRSEGSSVWKGLRECLVDKKVWVSENDTHETGIQNKSLMFIIFSV